MRCHVFGQGVGQDVKGAAGSHQRGQQRATPRATPLPLLRWVWPASKVAADVLQPLPLAQNTLPQKQQSATPVAQRTKQPGRSFDMPSFGGGAFDPVSAMLAISMAGTGIVGYRKRRKSEE